MTGLRGADIHARIGPSWPAIHAELGVGKQFLRFKTLGGKPQGIPGPCPVCGGTDRYVYDLRYGRGDSHCRACGHRDGFELLMALHGWSFPEARRRVVGAARLEQNGRQRPISNPTPASHPADSSKSGASARFETTASPPARVLRLRRESCAVADCPEVIDYLQRRAVWPLPEGCALRAHPGAPYFENGRQVGRFAALVADVVDVSGELVTVHVTYLKDGQKLTGHAPRKLLSEVAGREGCAVRLMPYAGGVLGIAEGIETATSASALDGVPVWAALNTSLLAKFEPPPGCAGLALYVDRDEAGLAAALKIFERLQGRMRVEARIPTAPAKDFNDVLLKRGTP
jgi:putative DNA primase/helicase